MKFLFTILCLTLSSHILASTHQEILFLQKAADVGTNGGDAVVVKKNFKKSEYKILVQELMNEIEDSECKFTPVIGRTDLKLNIEAFQFFQNSSKSIFQISNMISNKKIIGAIGYYWDGTNGDSEYCSTERLQLYFENGESLILSFDSTT